MGFGKLVVFRGKPKQLSARTRLQLDAGQLFEMSRFLAMARHALTDNGCRTRQRFPTSAFPSEIPRAEGATESAR